MFLSLFCYMTHSLLESYFSIPFQGVQWHWCTQESDGFSMVVVTIKLVLYAADIRFTLKLDLTTIMRCSVECWRMSVELYLRELLLSKSVKCK